eukprot:CAMPEP_0167745194 /NCGR_PEP_ID=MMETSP0110_2-20121227/3017_1 /TAXON_ID=629695 /ORGANISM="Gymnochlora sp., Strain CCMP2014" /LENGTH=321 /DNA_ID=CAMNT_0007629811 /DNA_START=131 /DNA_END=1093 /DNA_ORIENTATION=-
MPSPQWNVWMYVLATLHAFNGGFCVQMSKSQSNKPVFAAARLWNKRGYRPTMNVHAVANQRGVRLVSSEIDGDVVWITGASSGLGEALAKEYASRGNLLILSGRNEKQLQRVRDECNRISPDKQPAILSFDLSETSSLDTVGRRALEMFGRVDELVLCGGVSSRGGVLNSTIDVQEKVMRINHFGSVALTSAVLPAMLERNTGRVVHINSVQGKLGLPYRSAYGASKHASLAFFDSLRAEVSGFGVHVLSVQPGYIRTNLSTNAFTGSGAAYGKMDETTATGMDPEVVAKKIVDASERRAKEIILAPIRVRLAIALRNLLP